ncbi:MULTISPECIES: LysM peptidoglycan-binding domain-containing M23 family metallopeptidase [Streptomyces]|uniref:LysM peptidoglycan-binding domain-containing M23 family metallopeptidase n=1 Tax=Streptomyces solicathayae TaxID=3081768 RepID=A0ABZ0LNB8_9ACTN|nr:LysM peptidoglycan-binding domain-containing M23 family metallopeptidase [Streptomyces sp. HUAS YS2]WOX20978.1 LysM peptidoglycan-binding domain-containing M23 family metallopeptidase [Streptomyces sp. HUAS YS2]
MPAKGKHRRPKVNPITRGLVAAGAGGAVVALPLFGATGAHAAEQAAPSVTSQQAVAAVAAAKPAAAPQAAKAKAKTKAKVYKVVRGDYLSKIAQEHHLAGGWQKLYKDNRQVIGDNPSLIRPGMKLTLGAKSTAKPAAQTERKAAPKPAPKAAAKATETRASRSSERAAAPAAASGWFAPVSGGVSTPYRMAGSMWSSGYHTGADFIASTGTSVRAVGPGTVVSAGWGGAYGNEIVIQHADGSYSQYAHLSSLAVSAGETVTGGQQIGLSGSTGNVTGPHLHFEIRTGPSYGSDVDPLAYLRSHGVSI